MTRYEMIMRAAEHIERKPRSYSFVQGHVVQDASRVWTKEMYAHLWPGHTSDADDVPHCMLARMGQIAGAMTGTSCVTIAQTALGIAPEELYRFVDSGGGHFKESARIAAQGLRDFAKRYEGIPGDVREIFNVKPETVLTPA